ncbi:TetR/AcrR family transcriptional regulator [Hymenobacter setariae]|uniref:TetR/AcrR family transcriptional regulator n=1 Tax=Hymenobacter setariae TaxID=2594794 RepID=A0A558BS47_9BACT|nr:TetR/AcrR family transcriptional regulator [Hymenobacter setariae]TVT39321.1 TetR/AcrR family transcriptional regulator [Hymenobacter setariae]
MPSKQSSSARGRPTAYDNQEVLSKAQHLFWRKGYTATSLEELLAAMGIGSGSFYNAFKGGKKEVFRLALQQRREAFNQFEKELKLSADPMGLIRDFFRSIATADHSTHLQGCIVVNTVVEMAFLDGELEQEAVDILREVEQLFVRTIAGAQQAGQLRNQTDPLLLGRYLLTLWNGLNVTRRMHPNAEVLSQQIEMQLEILR